MTSFAGTAILSEFIPSECTQLTLVASIRGVTSSRSASSMPFGDVNWQHR
jgi:hypothetical protein